MFSRWVAREMRRRWWVDGVESRNDEKERRRLSAKRVQKRERAPRSRAGQAYRTTTCVDIQWRYSTAHAGTAGPDSPCTILTPFVAVGFSHPP